MNLTVEFENGRYHIKPYSAQCHGVSFKTKTEAEYVAKAIVLAYASGRDSIKSELRYLLNVDESAT